jgi:hypothetical protein
MSQGFCNKTIYTSEEKMLGSGDSVVGKSLKNTTKRRVQWYGNGSFAILGYK